MATIKLLTATNTPNSSFKLSSVSKDTIEVTDSFNSQLTKVTNAYSAVSSSLTAIQKQINSDASKYKDYLDSKRLNALKSFASAVKKQATNCDDRRKNMKEWANKDVTSIKEAAQRKAWLSAIDILLKENLSDSARAALQSLRSIL